MTNQPLTDQQLDDITARAKAATPGPWGVYEYGGGTKLDIAADLQDTGCGYRARREIASLEDEPLDNDPTHREWTAEEDWAQVQADAAFIAVMSPEVAQALVAEIRRLRAELRIGAPWKCDVCGKGNTRDVCVICETDRPDPAPAAAVVVAGDSGTGQ